MFKYPAVDIAETESKVFAQIATPGKAFGKNTSKEGVIKKVQFSRTVEVFKISPVKISDDWDFHDANFSEVESDSDDSNANDDDSSDCPSPIILGKSPSSTPKIGTWRDEIGHGKAKTCLFPQINETEKDCRDEASAVDTSSNNVGIVNGFMMFSQLTLLFEESFESHAKHNPNECDDFEGKQVISDKFDVVTENEIVSKDSNHYHSVGQEFNIPENKTSCRVENSDFIAEKGSSGIEVEDKKIPAADLFSSGGQSFPNKSSSVDEKAERESVQEERNGNLDEEKCRSPGLKESDFARQKFVGFRTAAGRSVSYSKEAEEKSRNLLQDLNENELQYNGVLPAMETAKQEFVGFRTAAGKGVSYSKEAEEKSRKLLQDLNENELKYNEVLPAMETAKQEFVGFRTAAGKGASYSKEAEEKSRKLLQDLNENELKYNEVLPAMETAKQEFVGFRTAAGKGVSYSKEAEEKSRKLLQDLNENELQYNEVLPAIETAKQEFVGFRTTAGKSVSYSKEAEEKSRKLLQDLNENELQYNGVLPAMETAKQEFVGFRTAAGKGVSYSTEAEEKSRKLLQDLNENGSMLHSPNKGKVFDDLSKLDNFESTDSSNEPPVIGFSGFTTVRVKPVPCSEESEKKSKKLLQNFNTDSIETEGVVLDNSDHRSVDETKQNAHASKTKGKRYAKTLDVSRTFETNDEILENSVVRTKQEGSSNGKEALSDCANYPKSSNTVKLYQLRNHSTSGKSFKHPRCLFEVHEQDSKSTSKNDSSIEQTEDSKYISIDSADTSMPCFSKTRLNKLSSCKFKSPIIANKLVHGNHRTVGMKTSENSSPTVPSNKMGRISTLRSLCVAKLSLEDLTAINDHRASIHSKTSSKKLYSIARQAVFQHDFSFQVEDFSPKGVSSGIVHVGDNAEMNIQEKTLGYPNFYRALLTIPGVTRTTASTKWVKVMYQWIVSKLAAYELAFPYIFPSRSLLNPNMVMEQLKYKFDKEYHLGQRSALRKIIEHDDTPARCMILVVSEANCDRKPFLEVTDGWYCVFCEIDAPILNLIRTGRLTPGRKIAVCGCQLLNADHPTEPLEASESLRLKLSYNGCKPALWDAKLGFYRQHFAFVSNLKNIKPDGGNIPALNVVIQRLYPLELSQTFENGNFITKTERQHRRDENLKRSRNEKDCSFTEGCERIAVKVLLRARVSDTNDAEFHCVLNIWQPTEDLVDQLKEGKVFRITNVRPHFQSRNFLNDDTCALLASRSTCFIPDKKGPVANSKLSEIFSPRVCNKVFNPAYCTSKFGEYDLIGIVVRVNDAESSSPTLFICDELSNVAVILFCSSLNNLALDKIVDIKSVLFFHNLKLSKKFVNNVDVLHFEFCAISDVETCKKNRFPKFEPDLNKILSSAQQSVHKLIHGSRLRSYKSNSAERKRSPAQEHLYECKEEKSFEWRMKKLNRLPSPPKSMLFAPECHTPIAKRARMEFKSPVLP